MSDARNILELYVENVRSPQMHVFEDGSKRWLVNGMYHRLDGPAIERPDGEKMWVFLGMVHRLDGAAVEKADGGKEWWVSGRQYRSIADWARAALQYERKEYHEEPTQEDVDDKIAQVMNKDLFD
jgi:hypothetical protein